MELFFGVLISAFASTYLVELVSLITRRIFSPKLVRMFLTPVLSFSFLLLLGFSWIEQCIGGLAASFLSALAFVVIDAVTSKSKR